MTSASQSIVLTRAQVRPRAFKLSSSAWPVEVSENFKAWNWVCVLELILCLGRILERRGDEWKFRGTQDLFLRFALINKREDGIGLFTWVSEESFGLHKSVLLPEFSRGFPALYIPERWSNLIIEMVEQGIVAVSSRADVRDGGRIIGYDLIAHFPDKSTKLLHWQGHDKYKLHEMPAQWKAEANI